jgi:hypothetical protein
MYVSFLKFSTEVESASKQSLDFLRSFALTGMTMSYVTEKHFREPGIFATNSLNIVNIFVIP